MKSKIYNLIRKNIYLSLSYENCKTGLMLLRIQKYLYFYDEDENSITNFYDWRVERNSRTELKNLYFNQLKYMFLISDALIF